MMEIVVFEGGLFHCNVSVRGPVHPSDTRGHAARCGRGNSLLSNSGLRAPGTCQGRGAIYFTFFLFSRTLILCLCNYNNSN